MNYKEMYEQAIERCKIRFGINVAAELFPELAESEDERIRKDIVEAVELHKDFTQGRKERIYAWLEKQGKQEPVKLSEEDESIKTIKCALLSCCKGSLFNYELSYDGYEKCLSRLASLIPQNRWKPSDEQMKALKEAVDEHFDIDGGALWHLYEDLKKL